MNRTLKNCLLVMAWAGIGTFLALEFNAYFWWLGALLGALGGYLTHEWRTVIWAIPHAWRRTINWKPNREYWKTVLYVGLAMSGLFLSLITLLGAVTTNKYIHGHLDTQGVFAIIFAVLAFFFIYIAFTFCFAGEIVVMGPDKKYETIKNWKEYACCYNFLSLWLIVVPALCFYFLLVEPIKYFIIFLSHLIRAVRTIPRGLKISARFSLHLYKLIHSEERWLASVDVFFGAVCGYFFENIFVGMLFGGAFWLVNYLLIAKLWLKTIPQSAKT